MNFSLSKLVYVKSDTYWSARKESGHFSCLDFDTSCGLKHNQMEFVDVKTLAFNVIDVKKFEYACLKYDLDYAYKI